MSTATPLVPPLAVSEAVVLVGSGPPRVVGTENDIRHPVLVGHFTDVDIEPKFCTLRNIKSVSALNTSVTGEQVVFAVDTASTVVPLEAIAFDVIASW